MLSVVIPAKNEPYLTTLLKQLPPAEIHIQTEQGLGHAVLKGIHNSHGNIIAVLDADGSHPPRYISAMEKLTQKYDIVIGSRYIAGGATHDPFTRKIISRCYCAFAQALFKLKVSDCMSGFIVAKKTVYQNTQLNPLGYKFGLELLVKARRKYTVAEYPIVFEQRKMGRSKTSFGQALQTFVFIAKLFVETKTHDS